MTMRQPKFALNKRVRYPIDKTMISKAITIPPLDQCEPMPVTVHISAQL